MDVAAAEREAAALLRTQPPFEKLARALETPQVVLSAGGAALPGAALLVAALSDRFPGRNMLVVTAGEEEAEDFYAALKTFASPEIRTFFFPSLEGESGRGPGAAAISARLRACRALACEGGRTLVVAPVQSVVTSVPSRAELLSGTIELEVGRPFDPEELCEKLAAFQFQRLLQVEMPGDFARRGGIVDIYPYDAPQPLRLEADGEVLSEIRAFDPVTQRSVKKLDRVSFSLCSSDQEAPAGEPDRSVVGYLRPEDLLVVLEEPLVRERGFQALLHRDSPRNRASSTVDMLISRHRLKLSRCEAPEDTCVFSFAEPPPSGSDPDSSWTVLKGFLQTGGSFFLYCANEGDRERLEGLLRDRGFPVESDRVHLLVGDLREGFMLAPRVAVLSTRQIFGRRQIRRRGPVEGFARPARGFFALRPGDLAVHVAHGIGRYVGTERVEQGGTVREFLVLEYRGGVKLYVPADKADLVSKYVGTGRTPPKLDKLMGRGWLRRCEAVERAVRDFASELLEIHARRETHEGFAFPPDDQWQRQLEASFPFEDTPDQHEASEAVKRDMMSPRCMDRLLCGDVGYGKTEIAVRAAFKAVCGGKQVAMLVPTTVLAEQHYQTFKDRLSAFPVTIEVLSRFQSKTRQAEIVKGLREKKVDIVIGTHRLLSDDVAFADLGLVIIDEEQRFGVAHKEKFKRLRATVDVLTMTATPIPRTLHMALLGLRDISNLTTPPEGRSPVITKVCRWDPELIRSSILRELDRDGQVYFVHNRVYALARLKRRLEAIVPEARIAIAHGQLSEKQLAGTMCSFLRREIDVLLCTTIIESGLDIPSVNTIFVAEADRYGLAELHQLRGRVGRYRHQAYAYFLLPEGRRVSREGEKRLRAIERFSELGAGFEIALKDLELRGAGNILGPQQSGHIAQVGYDMYCKLLRRAVARLRNERISEPSEVTIQLRLDSHLPEWYVPDESERLELYRRISAAVNEEELNREEAYLRDCFGPLPEEARYYIALKRLRIRLAQLGITTVAREIGRPAFKQRPGAPDLSRRSPVPVKHWVQDVFVLDREVSSDREAFEVLLEWSGETLKRLACGEEPWRETSDPSAAVGRTEEL